MKRLFISLLLVICALISFAQNESEHLTFKGVPIDGTLREYVEKMKNAGFEYVGEENKTANLQGEFAGFKECTIVVSTLKFKDLVNSIGVIFPANEKWWGVENDYNKLKSMLVQKYGDPSECVEKFKGYTPDTDSAKKLKLRNDEYSWFSIFTTPKGNIQLSVAYQSTIGCFVTLKYSDKINTESIRSHAINDL